MRHGLCEGGSSSPVCRNIRRDPSTTSAAIDGFPHIGTVNQHGLSPVFR
jgi:hypothetical protein